MTLHARKLKLLRARAVIQCMSFVPFFYKALQGEDSASPERAAQHLNVGKALADAIEESLAPWAGDVRPAMTFAMGQAFLDRAVAEPTRSFFHLAKYLALNGEHIGAGQLLEGHQRSDASLTRARAIREARTDAMRQTKAAQRQLWRTAVKKAGERIRRAERGWPKSDIVVAREILGSKEVRSLPGTLRPGESTVRAALRELGLGAKQRRAEMRQQNLSRVSVAKKSSKPRELTSKRC